MKQNPTEWLFLMLNNPNSDQDFNNKLLLKAKELEDNFIIEFYNFVKENYTEIGGYYDLKETSYWNFEKKTINELLNNFKNK